MSEKTWGQAKNEVAQVVGGQGDAETLAAAQAQITAVFEDWNARRNWQFLQVKAEDIEVVAGTAEYDLPNRFKRPYAAIFGNEALKYITRREYNLVDPTQVASHPYYYTLFNHAETGKIELIPSPSAASGVLNVWYYRLMTEGPTTDGDLLDILSRYTNYILDGARARLLGLKGPTEKLPFWAQMSERGYAAAAADDEHIPDEDAGIAPQSTMRRVPHDNSFLWADWGW